MARCSILSIVVLLHIIVLATAVERDRNARPKRLERPANPLLADVTPTEFYITIMRTDGGEKFACSGVLVAADMALTAASCYCNDTASMCRLTGNTYIALFGTDNQATAASTNVKQIRIHPNFNGDPSAGYDFAAVKLEEAVPKIVEGVHAVPIIYTNDLFCHDTVVQAFSWPEDGTELIRFTGNTSADTVGQRGVQVWNSALNSSKYTWPNVCEQSDCEPSIVVAHGIGDEYCTLNPGAPLFRQVGNQTGLVGLFSFGLMNGTRCTGKLPDGGQAPQYFSQASAAIPFLQALGATIRQPLGSVCGDGRKGLSEQCDDGNTNNGDGCSSECKSESGWVCSTYHKLNEEVCWKSSCSKLDGNGGSNKSGIITGAIIGGVVGAVALAIIPIVLLRRRRHHKKSAAAAMRAPTTPATGGPPGSARARTGIKRAGEDMEAVVGGTKVPILSAPPPTPANGIIAAPRGASALSPAVLTGTAGGVHAPSMPAVYMAGSEDPQSPTTGSNSGSQRGLGADAPNRTG